MQIGIEEASGSVDALEGEWRALQARCPQATPCQTWEWNAVWWRHFRARKRPRILLFRDGLGALVGIAPCYTSFHLATPLRRLAWMGTGPTDYLGPLALLECEAEVAATFLEHVRHRMRGWDIADLQQLRADSSLVSHAALVPQDRSGSETMCLLPMEPCPYLPLPGSWEALTAQFGKKMRSNLGYYERLLLKTFPDARYTLADAATLDEGMTALFALHQRRWNARWLPGALGSRRIQAFHRDLAQRFLENGGLRLHLLSANGAIQAALYCFAWGNRTFYYLGGFAPDLSKYSLGTLLTARAVKQALAEGHSEFDFLRGNEAYKYKWTSCERINHRLLLLRSRERLPLLGALPGRAGFALNRVERYVEHRAKAFAEQQARQERRAPDVPGHS